MNGSDKIVASIKITPALTGALALTVLLLAKISTLAANPRHREFENPTRVRIEGYQGDAMDPFISRDERFLFFNDSNDPGVNTNLHYAKKIDHVTFKFMGEVGGANSEKLDAVASLDENDRFYFTTLRSYNPIGKTYETIYAGEFDNGEVKNASPVRGDFYVRKWGKVTMDVEVDPAGQTLYLSSAAFPLYKGPPRESDLRVAVREGDRFVTPPNEKELMAAINTRDLEYAPSISADGLELFFTRLDLSRPSRPEFKIMRAVRSAGGQPFAAPRAVLAVMDEGVHTFVEAPSISRDGKRLYYHKKENGRFVIYVVFRKT